MKARKIGTGRTLALRSEAKRRASQASFANQATLGSRSIINPAPSASSISKRQTTIAYTCAGCDKPIRRDRFLLKACDKFWHENCLKCDRCGCRLGELDSTFYTKSDMNLCRNDYLELFGRKGTCAVCTKLVRASELVMRARENVYHLECFACQLCNQRFCVGDQFYLCDNKVICQYDYLEHIVPLQQSFHALTSSSEMAGVEFPEVSLDDNHQLEEVGQECSREQELTLLDCQPTKQEPVQCNMEPLSGLSKPLKVIQEGGSTCNPVLHETCLPENPNAEQQQPIEGPQQMPGSLLVGDISTSTSSSSSSSLSSASPLS